jgi:hypothetical protein
MRFPPPNLELVLFLVAKLHHFAKTKMQRKIYDKVLEKNHPKKVGKNPKIVYNMKEYLKFFYFQISNITKFG